MNNDVREIDAQTFLDWLEAESLQLVDVRELFEQPKLPNYAVHQIPMNQILVRGESVLDPNKKTVVFCQKGIRSYHAVELLQQHLGLKNLYNLKGGMMKLYPLLKK